VNEIDARAAAELGVEELPVYDVCPSCNGSGKAERSKECESS